jgi:NDP-sugar pyrophosphorylase family protein
LFRFVTDPSSSIRSTLFVAQALQDITLSLSYQPNKIEQLLGDGSDFGVKLKYTVEPQPMGTAGAYKFAEDLIREPTVVFNGDILTDLDLKAVIREHNDRGASADSRANSGRQSARAMDLSKRKAMVVSVGSSKSQKRTRSPCNTINAGTYILEPKVLDFIPAGENYSFEYGLFPDLLKRQEPFFAHIPGRVYWIDIGTPERYLRVHADLLSNSVGRIHIKERRGQFDAATVAEIDEQSMLGDDCQIKPGAQIINSVLGQGCFVEERARVENSVIWPHTRIGTAAQLTGAIVGRGCHIGRSALVGPWFGTRRQNFNHRLHNHGSANLVTAQLPEIPFWH